MKAFVNTVLILFGSVFIFRALQPAWHPPITSPEAALQRLESKILPAIDVQTAAPITMDSTVTTVSAPTAADRLPAVEAFPLYGGDALPQNPGNAVLRIEIVSSVEKADGRHPENRWLVDVAERFNQRRERIGAGPPIEVVVRAIPSGLGAQMLAAGKMRPAGYSPAAQSWLELLRHQGLLDHAIGEGVEVGRQGALQLQEFRPERVVHEAPAQASHHGGAALAAVAVRADAIAAHQGHEQVARPLIGEREAEFDRRFLRFQLLQPGLDALAGPFGSLPFPLAAGPGMDGLNPAELLHQLLLGTGRRSAAARRGRGTSEALVRLAGALMLFAASVVGVAGAAADVCFGG
jgi:hypothetical protein